MKYCLELGLAFLAVGGNGLLCGSHAEAPCHLTHVGLQDGTAWLVLAPGAHP